MIRATVDLESGAATVDAGSEVRHKELVDAVKDTVILSWARSAMARLNWEGS